MPSREWELARRLATPEEPGQRDFVAWLEQPIDKGDKKHIVERYEALRILFGTMGPPAAHRLHERMTDQRDPLGEFARLELAEWHRQQLISLLASRARGFDRGITIRGTTPPPPPKPDDIITGRPPYIPPPIPAPRTPPPVPPKPPPPPTITVPTVPKFDPKTIYVNIDPKSPSWLAASLSGVAKIAGVGISILAAVIPAGVMEKAIQAAWLVYQLETLPAKALVGLAGEKAAEAIAVWVLEDKLGIPVSTIINLNSIEPSFIGLDLLAPELPISVKTLGVLSGKAGPKLEKNLLSGYKNAGNYLFDTNDWRYTKYQEKIGTQLLKNHDKLTARGVWPSSVSGSKVDAKQVAKFVRDKGVMMIPDDHVQMVRRHMGTEYFTQYQQGKLAGFQPGLSDQIVAPQISDLVSRRFQSSGLKTTDYRAIADVAARLPEARDAVLKRGVKKWPAEWGDPPPWAGTARRP